MTAWAQSLIRISNYEVETLQKRLAEIAERRGGAEMKLAVLDAEAESERARARADAGSDVAAIRTRAERDGDDILGVIAGSAVTSDGKSNGIFAPNPEAQVDVLRRAYADAWAAGRVAADPVPPDELFARYGLGRNGPRR